MQLSLHYQNDSVNHCKGISHHEEIFLPITESIALLLNTILSNALILNAIFIFYLHFYLISICQYYVTKY